MAASRGTPTDAVRSGTLDRLIVLSPAASILLCTSPTDQQQIGQPGIRTTAFTPSCFMPRIMATVLSSRSTCGCRV
jgi:hypothetical protein